jgi:hypothetical protein
MQDIIDGAAVASWRRYADSAKVACATPAWLNAAA